MAHTRYRRVIGGQRITLSVSYHRGHRMTLLSAISIRQVEAALMENGQPVARFFLTFIIAFPSIVDLY